MFSIRCIINTSGPPVKYQTRRFSAFHRGVRFLFRKNLLLTNSITSGAFMAMGDLVQQEFELQANLIPCRYDWARAARMFTMGVIMGPLHHYYYIKLDKLLPKADLSTVFKKIICDQAFCSPLTILCFFYGMGVLENKNMVDATDEIKTKFRYVYTGDCFFWPPVQFINFYYLPTHYRVFYINAATMIFNIFLSYMKHYDQH